MLTSAERRNAMVAAFKHTDFITLLSGEVALAMLTTTSSDSAVAMFNCAERHDAMVAAFNIQSSSRSLRMARWYADAMWRSRC